MKNKVFQLIQSSCSFIDNNQCAGNHKDCNINNCFVIADFKPGCKQTVCQENEGGCCVHCKQYETCKNDVKCTGYSVDHSYRCEYADWR